MRCTSLPARWLFSASLSAISGCGAITGDKEKAFSLSIDDASVTVAQGSKDSVFVAITRTNFNDPISLSVVGALPAGVSATFKQNPIQDALAGSYLRFTATGAATPGTVTLTVRAVGEGLPDKGLPVDVTVTVTGSYTLGVLNSSITVAQGGAGETTVLLTRVSGNASNVALEVTGAPTGLGATVATPIADRAATLSVTAAAGVAPGTYPLTIKGSAAGLSPDQTTQLSVVVIAPPSTTSISIPFCSGSDMPIWFAVKNEGFGWQRVTQSGNSFSFAATPKVGIAYVRQFGTEFETFLFFASRAEIASLNDRDCAGPKTLAGTASGLTSGQTALVVMGASAATTTTGNYTLQGVASRTLDLVATRGTLSSGLMTPDKMIVRHGLDLTSTIPALDFNATEAFVPVTANLTVNGFTSGFNLFFQNNLWTATSTYGTVQSGTVPGGTTTFASVPASQLAPGDVHELLIDAFQSDGLLGHALFSYFDVAGNRTETVGPLVPGPTISTLTTAPYARLRAQLASQTEYPTAVQFGFGQGATGPGRILYILTTSSYLNGTPSTWDMVIPDFNGIAGFSNTWMLSGGQPTAVLAVGFSGRGELVMGGLPVAGDVMKLGYRQSVMTLALRQPGAPELFGVRRTPVLNQYLRR